MTQLIKVSDWSGMTRGHVIFVHGLGGHPYDTWRREKNAESFWPLWLAGDLEGVTVWTLAYAAPPTNWVGNALPLQDRAVSVLERLLTEPGLSDGPIVFVCHSLGGLVVKQLLREADGRHSPDAKTVVDRVKAVVFYATPHTGSSQASLMDFLRLVIWPSVATTSLVRNDPNLRSLNVWYRNWPQNIRHKLFYETHSTAFGKIVDAGSADAGLPGVVPIPIEADHVNVCKPVGHSDQGYVSTREFLISEVWNKTELHHGKSKLNTYPLPSVKRTRPSTWVPVLVRLWVLIAIGIAIYYQLSANSIEQNCEGDDCIMISENPGTIIIGPKSKPTDSKNQ